MFSIDNYHKKKQTKVDNTTKYVNNLHKNHINNFPNLAIFAFDKIGIEISLNGLYERKLLDILENTLFKKINFENSLCLDIGAHIGNHSLFFSKYFERIFSFEPHPDHFYLLKFNVRKTKNVNVNNIGISNSNKIMKIGNRGEKTSSGDSSLINLDAYNQKNSYEEFDINVEKIDDFLKNNEIIKEIKFIKIDVEMHEVEVLEGMKNTLLNQSPILFIEQHNDVMNSINNEVSSPAINLLKDSGYKYFYEPYIIKKWRFAKTYRPKANSINPKVSIIDKFLKFIEVVFFKNPNEEKKLLLRNKFYKTKYMGIIASKTPLPEDIVF